MLRLFVVVSFPRPSDHHRPIHRQHHNLRSLSMWFSSRWLYDTTSWAPITFWKSINYFNHSTRTRSFSYRCRASWLCICGCARGAFLCDSHRNVVLNFCQIAASLDHDTHTPDDSGSAKREKLAETKVEITSDCGVISKHTVDGQHSAREWKAWKHNKQALTWVSIVQFSIS